MLDPKYSELIAKQFLGTASAEEEKEINDWLDKSQDNRDELRAYKLIWSKTKIQYKAKNSEEVFDKISAAFNDTRQRNFTPRSKEKKSYRSAYLVMAMAAVILLAIIASPSLRNLFTQEHQESTTTVSQINRVLPKGQKLKVFLPDGSTAWLNAESTLSFPERFAGSSRIVELNGEAFFSVKKDTLKPFIVRLNHVDVTVLGTTFNVRSYQGESDTEVALESGKVLVSLQVQDKQQVFLSPGEGISINNTSGEFYKKEIDPLQSYGWKDGILTFKDASLEEIVAKLSRWYGVEIEVQNFNHSTWAYSGEFQNEYLSNVLESISFSKDFEYQLDQNKVMIKF